jgi:hypothetical protein
MESRPASRAWRWRRAARGGGQGSSSDQCTERAVRPADRTACRSRRPKVLGRNRRSVARVIDDGCCESPSRQTRGAGHRSRPNRAHVRQRPSELRDVDPRALVVMTVGRHTPLLQPAAPISLDDPDLVLARLFEKGPVPSTGHTSSKPELIEVVHKKMPARAFQWTVRDRAE